MEPLLISEIARVINAEVYGQDRWHAMGVSTDTRTIAKKDLFFAIKGITDGHRHIGEAFTKGAAAAIVDRFIPGVNGTLLVVWDTKSALGALARFYRRMFNIPVVAVTGSVGKTSIKEMIAHVLASRYRVLASPGNYNTEIGLPWTVFQLGREHECAVLEMATRAEGQIAMLTKMACPTVGVVTNIGMSHIEFIGSQEDIARAKSELLSGLDPAGVAILNKDSPFFDFLHGQCCPKDVITFSGSNLSDFRVEEVTPTRSGQRFKINGQLFELPPGTHHPINTAAVCAVAKSLNIGIDVVAERLKSFSTPPSRGNILKARNGALLVDDTYNAAPDSVCSALASLRIIAEGESRRAVAILGDMAELGEHGEAAHRYVGQAIAQNSVEVLVAVGPLSRHICSESGLPPEAKYLFATSEEAAKEVHRIVLPDDIVLVKGSRSMRMERILGALNGRG